MCNAALLGAPLDGRQANFAFVPGLEPIRLCFPGARLLQQPLNRLLLLLFFLPVQGQLSPSLLLALLQGGFLAEGYGWRRNVIIPIIHVVLFVFVGTPEPHRPLPTRQARRLPVFLVDLVLIVVVNLHQRAAILRFIGFVGIRMVAAHDDDKRWTGANVHEVVGGGHDLEIRVRAPSQTDAYAPRSRRHGRCGRPEVAWNYGIGTRAVADSGRHTQQQPALSPTHPRCIRGARPPEVRRPADIP